MAKEKNPNKQKINEFLKNQVTNCLPNIQPTSLKIIKSRGKRHQVNGRLFRKPHSSGTKEGNKINGKGSNQVSNSWEN